MSRRDDLGSRMKDFYESIPKTKLMRRTPVAIRIDGKAFHTFTRGFQKPFDDILMSSMQETMQYLCENIQGCVIGYTQSDEITLILCDYQTLESSAWFDYEVMKLCSISASMATLAFNNAFTRNVRNIPDKTWAELDWKYADALEKAMEKGAMFDSRCFNIPKEEVTNLLYWRQLDAIRNSIQMVGQANFSAKELHGKSCADIKEMLAQKGIVWDELPTVEKRGCACIRYTGSAAERESWHVDYEMPVLKGENREYVESRIWFG